MRTAAKQLRRKLGDEVKELESERLSLHGEAPQGLLFAEGYPDEQTLEVMIRRRS